MESMPNFFPKERTVTEYTDNRIPKRSGRLLKVQTDDNYTFMCDTQTLKVSPVLRLSLEEELTDNQPLRITGISHKIVQRLLWWMDNHLEDIDLKENTPIDETMDSWQRCFFSCTIDIIIQLIIAANYLNIRRLMILGINRLAEVIDEKFNEDNPVRAIRDAFHVPVQAMTPNDRKLDETISRLFVFDRNIRMNGRPSKIDVLEVEVTHLLPRKLQFPKVAPNDK